jgi:hypothetical protein
VDSLATREGTDPSQSDDPQEVADRPAQSKRPRTLIHRPPPDERQAPEAPSASLRPLNVDIAAELHYDLKCFAVLHGQPLRQIVSEFLRRGLSAKGYSRHDLDDKRLANA